MKLAYVDTSCLVALAFDEPGAAAWSRRLSRYDELVTANLTEAEFRAALRREGVEGAQPWDSGCRTEGRRSRSRVRVAGSSAGYRTRPSEATLPGSRNLPGPERRLHR